MTLDLVTVVKNNQVEHMYDVRFSQEAEDSRRAGLMGAIAIIAEAKHGGDGWFKLCGAAQEILIHVDRYLNEELKALLTGTFDKLEEERMRKAARR